MINRGNIKQVKTNPQINSKVNLKKNNNKFQNEEEDKENTNMQNIKTKKKILLNNLKEIKTEKGNQNQNMKNDENQFSKTIKINNQVNHKRSKSKTGLRQLSSTSKIKIVS